MLFICDRQGLIGREMFAIDGVKRPSNASKARSGTRTDFERQAGKLEAAAVSLCGIAAIPEQASIKRNHCCFETARTQRS